MLLNGHARFADPHTLNVTAASGEERRVTAAKIVIAVGTRPARPATVAFDGHRVLSSDDILGLDWLPNSLVVVGAGVIGIEYASMFAALGCKVTVVEQRRRLLEFCDSQIIEALQYHLRDLNVIFRFDEKVTAVEKHGAGAVTHLASGKLIPADAVLYSTGRQGATDSLDLENAGSRRTTAGRIAVERPLPDAVKHIYAVGDVIGFPSLAATSMEQGRLAACDAFGVDRQTDGQGAPDRDLHDPRDQLRRTHRGGADRRRRAVRDRHRPVPGARARPDPGRRPRHAEAARLGRPTTRCSASTPSAPARPSSSTSASS